MTWRGVGRRIFASTRTTKLQTIEKGEGQTRKVQRRPFGRQETEVARELLYRMLYFLVLGVEILAVKLS